MSEAPPNEGSSGDRLFKIVPSADWDVAGGVIPWAEVDRADGFIHLSSARQVEETARKHFADRDDLVLVEVFAGQLSDGTLRWEVSRGGELFPHVYGDIPAEAVGRAAGFSTEAGADFPMDLLVG